MNLVWRRASTRHMAAALVAAALFASACSDSSIRSITPPESDPSPVLYDRSLAVDAPTVQVEVVGGRGVLFNHAPPSPGQVELVQNGGFELNGGTNTNSFIGWTVTDLNTVAANSWKAQTGTTSPPPSNFVVPAPPYGTYAAMSTQGGGGTHIIHQVITLPAGGNGQLSFRLFIGNRAGAFVSPATLLPTVPNQQFRMDIMNPAASITDVGAGVLMNVYQTRPGDPLVSAGYLTITANLSAFNGQTVRLRFAEVDNQYFFNVGLDHVSVIATVNQAPTANAGPDQTVEATGASTLVQLDGTAADGDNNIASVVWTEGATTIATGEDPQVSLATGSHTLKITVTDAFGLTASDEVTINVQDTTPPAVSLNVTPGSLWPPNGKYVNIDLGLVYSDIGAGALTVTAAAVSSDADDATGNGDGNTTGDVKAGAAVSSNASPVVTFDPLTTQLQLRAERGGSTAGRTYTITVTVTDAFNNSTTVTGTVTVPHNQ